jgi:hypothetical protein
VVPKVLRIAADKVLSPFCKGLLEILEGQMRIAIATTIAAPQQMASQMLVFVPVNLESFIARSFAAPQALP